MDKKDEEAEVLPFQGIEKGILLQEKRTFNEVPLNPRKCAHLLTKILYLLVQGETLTPVEATDLFFAVTKLFQTPEPNLRRLVYQVLKELAPMANDVIIITSSLTKDINSRNELYKANAIRVLCRILTDVSLLGQGERYLKQAIVDKEPCVASSALTSGIHLMRNPINQDYVKRWFSEVQEATKSKHAMVQYHALGLFYQLKKTDRLGLLKFVSSMTRSTISSPYTHCLLIRFAFQVLDEDPEGINKERGLYDYLESCLRNKSDIVSFEAARAICSLKSATPKELASAVGVLQLFLSSPKASVRFAAVRTLNKISIIHRIPVAACNLDMENLITDPNRSIATLAITTLLKTGNEVNIDRLMKQISNFMGEISDEFKIVVVDAIKTLCTKYPDKFRSLMTFLSGFLREEGGFEYKKTIVESFFAMINEIPASKETGMSHLCEFIEDCEHPYLSTKILHLLGKEGPDTTSPSKFIRYIYNRVILESPSVRVSAVSALAKFGVSLETLRPSIISLLKRCLFDNDDDVRDRATLYIHLLENDIELAKEYILKPEIDLPIINLEQALLNYRSGSYETPFDFSVVPKVIETKKIRPTTKTQETTSFTPVAAPATTSLSADWLKLPQLAGLGQLFKSSKEVELSGSEMEYVVQCIKHIFPEHIVFQFIVTNTINEQVLDKVTVKLEPAVEDLSILSEIPALRLLPNVAGQSFVLASRPPDSFPTGTISCILKFIVKDIDPSTNEVDETGREDEDEYPLAEFDLTISDYVQKRYATDFNAEWEELGEENQCVEVCSLSTMKAINDQELDELADFLGLLPCDRSNKVGEPKNKHILYLAGLFQGGVKVLARARMKLEASGVQVELTVRSTDPTASSYISNALF